MNEAQQILEDFASRLGELTPQIIKYLDAKSAVRVLQETRALNRIREQLPLDDTIGTPAIAPGTAVKQLDAMVRILAIYRAAIRSRRPTEESKALLVDLDDGAALLTEAARFLREATDADES